MTILFYHCVITLLLTLLSISALSVFAAENVVELPPDPTTIIIQTASGDKSTENIRDVWANYPQLREKIKAEEARKLAAEDEIAAQKRFTHLNTQKIDIPKADADKHKARIAKFGKAKEDALNAAVKKSKVAVTIDSGMSSVEIAAQIQAVNDAQSLAQRAKAKKDELIATGIPISDSAVKNIEAAQPKPVPAPPAPSPTPGDGL